MDKDIKNHRDRNNEISNNEPATLFELSDFGHKKAQVRFALEETSNYGSLLLLKEVDAQVGLIDRLSGYLQDNHHPKAGAQEQERKCICDFEKDNRLLA